MSELIQKYDNRATIHWKLLASASALALTAYVSTIATAKAEDGDHPSIWLELGGQWERQTGLGKLPVPNFVVDYPDSPAFNPLSPGKLQRTPLFSQGGETSLSFQPSESDWIFTAGIRYGRSGGHKNVQHGAHITDHEKLTRIPTYHRTPIHHHYSYTPGGRFVFDVPAHATYLESAYEDESLQIGQSQKHIVLDFSAGKDVGLGMFGGSTSSSISAGIRFAQFTSTSSVAMHARPDGHLSNPCSAFLENYFASAFPGYHFQFCRLVTPGYHTFAAAAHIQRKFHGFGPSLSWKSSIPIAGNVSDEQLAIDWGVNAALLFGRQSIKGNHQVSGHYNPLNGANKSYYFSARPIDRSRRVTVPNVGGEIGMSLKFPNAKVSIGYRGDFFFGAMDTGIDAREKGTPAFYGPFASISIGLGD